MIDLEWLRSVRFDITDGRVIGLVGIGTQFVVFLCQPSAEAAESENFVLKIPNVPRLGFHIREIPPELELRPTYDPQRVCRKLRAQVGNPLFDAMVGPYNDLYEYMVSVLYYGGLDGVASMVDDETSDAIFTYFLGTPGLRRRIEDVASLDAAGHPEEVVTWNGLAIEETRAATASWAQSMVARLDAISSAAGGPPGSPSDNPFWIWGGAVLEGFFTAAEIADAVQFIEAQFGDLSSVWPRLEFEMYAFLSLLSIVVEPEKMQRLTEFCNLAGFGFVLPEPEPEPGDEPTREEEDRPEGVPIGRMPKLSAPYTVAPFPEEGSVDPMAQDPGLLASAAARFAGLATRMAGAAHAVGVSVTLPPADGSAAHGKPWRSVAPVGSGSGSQAVTVDDPPELSLVQRLFTSAQAVAARTGGEVPDGLAELMEEIGYVAIGRSLDTKNKPRLHAFHSLGAIAAAMHRAGFVHGDLQPENFTFKESGDIASSFDLGRTANPGRPLTPLERASDLAVLKKEASFLQWEAAKLGYRSIAPDADIVLAEFAAPDG